MDYKDINRLRQRVPELDVIAPVLFSPWNTGSTAYYGEQRTTPRVQGTSPEYAKVVLGRAFSQGVWKHK